MYWMGLMALICADIPEINRDKCTKMAIVEAIVGDITPSDGIPKHEKNQREGEALEHMCKLLGGGPREKETADLWMEYEENSTPEAKIVKDFDKVEMILQALEYENEQVMHCNTKKECSQLVNLLPPTNAALGRRQMLGTNENSFGDDLEKDIWFLLREQRRQEAIDCEKELNLYMSGSVPPTIEGSLSTVGWQQRQ